MPGGLDVTLGLDPLTHTKNIDATDVFLEYRPEDILQKGQIRLGPACADLIQYYKDICVVNGVSGLRDAGHEANLSHIVTGSMGGNLSHYTIQLAQHAKPTPLGTLTNSPIAARSIFAPLTDIESIALKLSDSKASLSVIGLSDILNSDLKRSAQSLESAEHETYEVFRKIEKSKDLASLCFSTIASCFTSGLSTSAALDMSRFISSANFDSHTNHESTHLKSQKNAWSNVAELFKIFKSIPYLNSSLFEHTTIVVVSEFSRTPYLNSSRGKDHNPYTNSILLAGKGINGNLTIGKSIVWSRQQTANEISLHTALPINIKTGEVFMNFSENLDLLVPENLGRSILELFKIKAIPPELASFSTIPNLLKA